MNVGTGRGKHPYTAKDLRQRREVIVPPIPHGPVKHTWYAHGYQAAMIDIAKQLDEGGVNAVREWLENNTKRG